MDLSAPSSSDSVSSTSMTPELATMPRREEKATSRNSMANLDGGIAGSVKLTKANGRVTSPLCVPVSTPAMPSWNTSYTQKDSNSCNFDFCRRPWHDHKRVYHRVGPTAIEGWFHWPVQIRGQIRRGHDYTCQSFSWYPTWGFIRDHAPGQMSIWFCWEWSQNTLWKFGLDEMGKSWQLQNRNNPRI